MENFQHCAIAPCGEKYSTNFGRAYLFAEFNSPLVCREDFSRLTSLFHGNLITTSKPSFLIFNIPPLFIVSHSQPVSGRTVPSAMTSDGFDFNRSSSSEILSNVLYEMFFPSYVIF